MRIGHLSDFYAPRVGGIETHVAELALRQAADGHDVEVITATAGSSHDGSAVRVVRVPGGPRRPGSAWHALAPRTGRRAIRSGCYDVLHVHAGVAAPLALAGIAAAVRAELPVVVTAHSLLSWTRRAFGALDSVNGWTGWPVVWTAVSQVAASHLGAALRGRREVLILPNAVDPARWSVPVAAHRPGEVVLVSVMRLATRKRPIPLLRMIRDVRASVPAQLRLRAVIIGEGPARTAMERFLRRHEMTDWVSLPGCLSPEQVGQHLSRADLYVAPARLESFGIAALEARQTGLPVIAMAGSGIADFVEHGRDGLLAHGDVDMVAALVRLATDPRARAEIAAHNRVVPPPTTWALSTSRAYDAYDRAAALVGRDQSAERLAEVGA